MKYQALGLIALGLALAACAGPEPAQVVVGRGPFVHRITADGELRAAKSTPVTAPADSELSYRLAWLAADGSAVVADQVIARFATAALERQVGEGRVKVERAELEAAAAELSSAASLAEMVGQFEGAKLELDHAERFLKKDELVFSRRAIAESLIDGELAQARRDHAGGSIATEKTRQESERAIFAITTRQAGAELERAQKTLGAAEVRSPHAGLLLLERDYRGDAIAVGSQVWQGMTIAQIPDLLTLEAQLNVLEADGGGLAEGQRAEIRVDALPGQVFAATVKAVDKMAKARSRRSPVQFFGVTLSFEAPTPGLKPGQRLRATIFINEESHVVSIPRQALFTGADGPFVYVRERRGFTARPVELGSASSGRIVIKNGLDAGEILALDPPLTAGPSTAKTTEVKP